MNKPDKNIFKDGAADEWLYACAYCDYETPDKKEWIEHTFYEHGIKVPESPKKDTTLDLHDILLRLNYSQVYSTAATKYERDKHWLDVFSEAESKINQMLKEARIDELKATLNEFEEEFQRVNKEVGAKYTGSANTMYHVVVRDRISELEGKA